MIIPILCAIFLAIIAILGGVFFIPDDDEEPPLPPSDSKKYFDTSFLSPPEYVDLEKEIVFQDESDEDDYQQQTYS